MRTFLMGSWITTENLPPPLFSLHWQVLADSPNMPLVNALVGAYTKVWSGPPPQGQQGLLGGVLGVIKAIEKRSVAVARAARSKAPPTAPPPGSSAAEQWRFYAGATGPWSAELAVLNGGHGLTALTDPIGASPLPGLMSFVGLESIKQQAVHLVQASRTGEACL